MQVITFFQIKTSKPILSNKNFSIKTAAFFSANINACSYTVMLILNPNTYIYFKPNELKEKGFDITIVSFRLKNDEYRTQYD